MSDNKKVKTTEDILKILCESVKKVFSIATKSDITFSPMIQRIGKTCLKPAIGCFVLFDGGFSGLIIINFSEEAAMEIYRNYMLSMGMPEDELAILHTSDEVSDSLGELMNQIIGDFQAKIKKNFQISVTQTQPRMLVMNKELMISINTSIESPQCRKVAFATENHRPFYLEISMEKTEFVQLFPFEKDEETIDPEKIMKEMMSAGEKGEKVLDPEKIMQEMNAQKKKIENNIEEKKNDKDDDVADDDFMKQLGL